MTSEPAISEDVLRRFLGPADFVQRDVLSGLVIEPVLAALSEETIGRVCELALLHECAALEQQVRARQEDIAADSFARQSSTPMADADTDGRACGASFCGFYHSRDVFTWAARAEPSDASRAVLEVRHAIEHAVRAAGTPLSADGELVRCEAWLNVLRHGDFLRLHDHAGALVSGVCWLHVPSDNDESNAQWWSGAFLAASQSEQEGSSSVVEFCAVRARERWCALFPGALHHAVLPFYAPDHDDGAPLTSECTAGTSGPVRLLLDDDWKRVRISLSFNFLPS